MCFISIFMFQPKLAAVTFVQRELLHLIFPWEDSTL